MHRPISLAALGLAAAAAYGAATADRAADAVTTADAAAATSTALADAATATRPAAPGATTQDTARAVMADREGRRLGEVIFEQTPAGVLIRGSLMGLPPGEHGIHIHETGRCEPTFDAAGDHYNPTGHAHGFRNPRGPHAGDLTNVHVMPGGRVGFDIGNSRISLASGVAPLFDADGSALIIHETADDYRTDPSGNSGGRIACGVITR